MDDWPSFLPPPYLADFETYTASGYNLKKLGTVPYVADRRFFVQCLAWADPETKTNGVLWHDDDIQAHLDSIDTANRTLVCHNTLFDGKIMREEYGKRFGVYVCTQAMARALIRHLTMGFSLDAVHECLFGHRIKDDTLAEMVGIREVPPELRPKYGRYAMRDVVAMLKILLAFLPEFPDKQWWHMDWTMQQFINPVMKIDVEACDQFIEHYTEESHELYGKYDAIDKQFTSSEKFAKLLVKHGNMFDPLAVVGKPKRPRIPIVQGAKTIRYDFNKKSEPFISQILESDEPTIRELGQLRLRAASSSELAQARSLKEVADLTKNTFALGVNYSGTATHRISGNGGACGVNVLAIKRGSLMRNSLKAPGGTKMLSFDMSAFELGICRFLAQDRPSMAALLHREGDIYVDFARVAYRDPTITKKTNPDAREVGKTSELQLQYNSGAKTLRSQLLEKGAHVTLGEAKDLVHIFRNVQHRALTRYWGTFGNYIPRMQRNGLKPFAVQNAPFLQIESGGIRLPSGLKLNFPDLRKRGGDWTYQKTIGQTFTRDKIYGGKLMQYCCQSLANVIIQEIKRDVAREYGASGLRVVHEVYDDLTMVVPVSFLDSDVENIMERAVQPLTWWPELPLSLEWGMGPSWGECKKENVVYGPLIK